MKLIVSKYRCVLRQAKDDEDLVQKDALFRLKSINLE